MTEIERIADQLQRAFRADAWCGSALLEALAGVTAEQAARRPLATGHNIWEIVLHVAGWKQVVRQRLAGEQIRLPVAGDWPKAVTDTSEAAWQAAIQMLTAQHAELLAAVNGLTDARLEDVLISESSRETGGGVSCYVTLHGAAQHDLYHAGQVALLKKS